ncbi:hypothetical protein Tco_1126100, partial [Tanacetum coccineum]
MSRLYYSSTSSATVDIIRLRPGRFLKSSKVTRMRGSVPLRSIFEQDPGFQGPDGACFNGRGNSNGSEVVQEGEMMENGKLDDLGVMFFDWLKSNKEVISAEDMRNIKLKRSTIESASKRLGSSKEGKKQLLKLILEWVQQNQLQRKNSGGVGAGYEFSATDATTTNNNTQYPLQQYQGLPPAPQQPPIAATPTPA